jgi:hypothetical protein
MTLGMFRNAKDGAHEDDRPSKDHGTSLSGQDRAKQIYRPRPRASKILLHCMTP